MVICIGRKSLSLICHYNHLFLSYSNGVYNLWVLSVCVVCVRVCICVFCACIHVCISVHMSVGISLYVCSRVCCICVHVSVCVCNCVYVYVCTYVHVCVSLCVCPCVCRCLDVWNYKNSLASGVNHSMPRGYMSVLPLPPPIMSCVFLNYCFI